MDQLFRDKFFPFKHLLIQENDLFFLYFWLNLPKTKTPNFSSIQWMRAADKELQYTLPMPPDSIAEFLENSKSGKFSVCQKFSPWLFNLCKLQKIIKKLHSITPNERGERVINLLRSYQVMREVGVKLNITIYHMREGGTKKSWLFGNVISGCSLI